MLPLVTGTIPRQPATRLRFNRRLFRWHDSGRRSLAIREAATPWQVLVAEVMAQQTGSSASVRHGVGSSSAGRRQPTRGGRHPRRSCAAWAGLGYNRRALAPAEAARAIVADHGGRVPGHRRGARATAGRRSVHGSRGRGVGLRRAGRAARREHATGRVAGARRVADAGPGCRRRPTASSRASRPGRWLDAVMDLATATCTPRTPRVRPRARSRRVCRRGAASIPVAAASRGVPFPATTRWLRGRLARPPSPARRQGLGAAARSTRPPRCRGDRRGRPGSRARRVPRPARRRGAGPRMSPMTLAIACSPTPAALRMT